MNLCKNCKYWSLNEQLEPLGGEVGNCSCPKFIYDVDQTEEQKQEKDILVYWDYESYSAGFETGPEFGCVHQTRKKGFCQCGAKAEHTGFCNACGTAYYNS